jgi:hypothetical protein
MLTLRVMLCMMTVPGMDEGIIEMDTQEAVRRILADVTDRRGWRQAWDTFDEDIQEEIKCTWLTILNDLDK